MQMREIVINPKSQTRKNSNTDGGIVLLFKRFKQAQKLVARNLWVIWEIVAGRIDRIDVLFGAECKHISRA